MPLSDLKLTTAAIVALSAYADACDLVPEGVDAEDYLDGLGREELSALVDRMDHDRHGRDVEEAVRRGELRDPWNVHPSHLWMVG